MGDTLNRLTDYSVTYSNNVNFGTATINVCGTGSYTDCKIVNFEIVGTIITPTIGIIADQPYTGSAVTPSVKVYNGETLLASSNYTVAYKNNINVGEATVTVTLKGNFSGSATQTFNIVPAKITPTIAAIADQTYTGSAIKPTVKVMNGSTEIASSNYTVSYKNNVDVGEATATVTLKNNYVGTASKTFNIVAAKITPTIAAIADQEYTGSAITPSVKVYADAEKTKLLEEYTVSYSNNVSYGTAKVTVTLSGNYAGTATQTFRIVGKAITPTIGIIADQPYTGSALTPNVYVYNGETLLASSNYTVTYENNVNVGEATATVTLKGDYTGKVSKTFKIVPANITPVIANIGGQEYTGSVITPSVKVYADARKTILLEDYIVSYSDNISHGAAKATVTLTGNYTGSATQTFIIYAKAVTPTIVEIEDQEYTGSEITPSVQVYNGETLLTPSDYIVTYEDNVNEGVATVIVELNGNYTGTASTTFNIVKSTKIRDMKKQSFKVISTNALNIHISNANIGTLCALFDLQGRLLKRFVIQNVDEVIQVDHSGAYLLKVGNETHKISVK
ncbi:MAG: hypothetical protein MR362_01740 [Hallerella sp.]|uniref:hypothetical protein n=1 Tax=Hallerella sp. TaxID=2815812 RepID=UPI00258B8812|nr:hypothetical protein [Hallerella sp.]MCI5600008.1 hypothetical protein [Hallerella sp.]